MPALTFCNVSAGGGFALAQGEPEDDGSRDGWDSSEDCAPVFMFRYRHCAAVLLSAATPRSLRSAALTERNEPFFQTGGLIDALADSSICPRQQSLEGQGCEPVASGSGFPEEDAPV